jgi:hypothetical protein
MRNYVLPIATAALFALATSAFSQGVEFGPGGIRIDPGYHGDHGDHRYYHRRSAYQGECRELRWACIHKEELGEEGLGNCRRYRESCQGRY